ncbi:TALPID3 protein [Bombina bombina]|uniref:TALPID3 protein n=1 Tax=Bombina bombina TaxID=8345 RepID=UPI00235B1767|nr:TALPID3 protein [Bombina bombina]
MLQRSVDTSMQDEDVLDKVYGKPIYQGNRSTLKKGPYLRFSSPSPKSKPHRPRILETVRGIKQKSAKTQTSATGCKVTLTKLKSQERFLPMMQEPQYLFSPTGQSVSMSAPMEGHLIPMAIPLGRSRFDGVCPLPSSVTLTRPHSVTITTSIPSSPPKPQARTVKPNVAVLEVLSEKKDPPQLSVQVGDHCHLP